MTRAALIDEDAGQATARVTSLAAGSIVDAAMIISARKSKVMHIHKTTRTNATTEADVAKLNQLVQRMLLFLVFSICCFHDSLLPISLPW